jgi:hypothetical protein
MSAHEFEGDSHIYWFQLMFVPGEEGKLIFLIGPRSALINALARQSKSEMRQLHPSHPTLTTFRSKQYVFANFVGT